MSSTDTCTSEDVKTTLRYLTRDPKYETEKPYRLVQVKPEPGIPESNMEFEEHCDIPINDMRPLQDSLTLDNNGFQLFTWPYDINSNATKREIENYSNAMGEKVKNALGANYFYTFDFRFRVKDVSDVPDKNKLSYMFASTHVHIAHLDQTYEGGKNRMRCHLTKEEYEEYFSGRWRVRIVNVWRSFNTAPQDMPLALCLPESVSASDFTAIDLVGPLRTGESLYLHHNPQQKWYWASDTNPSEALVFVNWDSETVPGGTKGACHTAFPNPKSRTEPAPRESLEIRMIVVKAL